MERKLVTIRQVKEILSIEGADRIVLSKIDGWQCVTRKDEFKVGDLGLYFEIDSVFPHTEDPATTDTRWEFLRPRHFRIKTMKMKGVLSQGLLLPLSIFPEIKEGDEDLALKLDVTKYEPPATFKNGETKGSFPTHIISKTDEERIQNCPDILNEINNLPYIITVKIDGTSGTFYYDTEYNEFNACSRNLTLKDGDNVYFNMAKKYHLIDILKNNPQYVIQCEIAGPGIQKNRVGLKEIEIFVFNIFDRNSNKFVDYDLFTFLCKGWNLPTVPIEEVGDSFNYTFEQLLEKANGFYNKGLNLIREGIVIRPKIEKYSNVLKGRLSFKAISNEYLLRYGD